jgi:hypothetical protein
VGRLHHDPEMLGVNPRQKILVATDRVQGALLVVLVLGSAVCFGGAVWWFPPAVAGLAFLLVATKLVQLLLVGRMPLLKSPLSLLGLLGLSLGVIQSAPLPARVARQVSPIAQEIYATGAWSSLVQADDPEAERPPAAPVRSPATLDRAATLRWLVGAAVCLAVFWTVSHYVDRRGRLYWVWGSVVAGFALNVAFLVVQLSGQAEGWFGVLLPERRPSWGPSLDDLLGSPTPSALRRLEVARPVTGTGPGLELIAAVPDRPYVFGTMVGGPGALLAMGSMALPMALAIVLHVLAPRGSRERLGERLGHAGQGGLAVLLVSVLVPGAFLAGMTAGPWLCLPLAGAMAIVGLPGARGTGGRWSAIGLTILAMMALGLGAATVWAWPLIVGGQPPVAPVSWEAARLAWAEGLAIVRDFPWLGSGFGSFATIQAYYKTQDSPAGFAPGSLLRCGAEAGLAGLSLLALGVLWSLARLPGCLRRVGSADRSLALGLIGALAGLGLWSALHWTVELPAVAIAASALGGTWNRWIAGGTDLFVERG